MKKISRRKTLKQVLKTSLPAVVDLSSQTFTWLIEAIFIGHISAAALAGVGISQQVILLTLTILLTFVVGSSIMIARFLGAKDTWSANHVLGQSLFVGFFLAIFIALIWYFGTPLIFAIIGEEEPIARSYGTGYISIVSWFAPLIITNFIAIGILRGAGDTLTTMKINLTTNVLNLILDVILIFGYFGFPRLETKGAGLAVGIAHTVGFCITIYVLRSRKSSLFLSFTELTKPNYHTFKKIVKMGVPTTIEQAIWSVGQLAMSIYAGWLGIIFLATHQVLVRIQSVITMIYFGFATGSMTLVGKDIGAANELQARHTGKISALVGLLAALGIASFLYFNAEWILSSFTKESGILEVGMSIFYIFALIQIPKGINVVYSGNLRGGAELTWLMWLAICTATGYEIIGSWFLAIPLGFGLAGIWAIQGIDELTRFSLNYWRFNKGKWKYISLDN